MKTEYKKMKKKYKDAWVAKLRSREYKQTQNYLQDSNGFCCLGVLCHMNKISFTGSSAYPPEDFQEKVGLDGESCSKLSSLNDISELKFGKIANWIEKNL